MDGKQKFLPALALGVGLGFGVATACTQSFNRWTDSSLSVHVLENELFAHVVEGAGLGSVTLDKFPYYLNEETKALLTNAAYVRLKHLELGKFTRNLSPASRLVLLSGPTGTERYHNMLANALAQKFQAKLLTLDILHFTSKMQMKFGNPKDLGELLPSNNSVYGGVHCINGLLGKESTAFTNRKRFDGSLFRSTKSSVFEDKNLVLALYKVLSRLSEAGPVILYLGDLAKVVIRGSKTVMLFQKMLNKLSGPVFVLSSRFSEEANNEQVSAYFEEKVTALWPYKISIKPPTENDKLVSWKSQLEEDMKALQAESIRNRLVEVLDSNDLKCEDLDSLALTNVPVVGSLIEEIVVSAVSHHLIHTAEPKFCQGKLLISSQSLVHGLNVFRAASLKTNDAKLLTDSSPKSLQGLPESSKKEAKGDGVLEVVGDGEALKNDTVKKADAEVHRNDAIKKGDTAALKKGSNTEGAKVSTAATPAKEFVADNEFEKRIRPEIIPAGEIGVGFQDIGALDHVKVALQELVMLPLQRPNLFSKGGLIKPCKGILLFGPPGTGKTMLAKAVATEAGASFINVSMSTITSKWFGEDEKNVRALFSLAAKVAPTILFIDEVDSMLGQRSRFGEHEAMRKIKNEFMAHWDGLRSKNAERVLVLAATNRPFDLDDAIIRRFERRIMVDLPDKENREKILKAILLKETVSDDVDITELASMTDGYSGSDLKNLCTVAAYRPIREFLKKEQERGKATTALSKDSNTAAGTTETEVLEPALRLLNMEDMRQAKSQVSSSYAAEGAGMTELKEWNELFGEGGSRKKQQLTYFL